MASKQQESLKATWVYNIAGFQKTLTLLQPTATSSKVLKHTGRLMNFIIYICSHIIYIHIYRYGLLPSSPQIRNHFSYLEQDHSISKDRSLTEAASVYLGLLCSTALATSGRDCRGDTWLEFAGCPALVKRKNGCKQSTASQNLSQRCT